MKLTIGDSAWWEYTEHQENDWQDSYYKVSAGDRSDGVYWAARATLSSLCRDCKYKYEGKLEIEWKWPMKQTALQEFVLDKAQVRGLLIDIDPRNSSGPYKAFELFVDYANKLLENKP